jgi:hypothetical protein
MVPSVSPERLLLGLALVAVGIGALVAGAIALRRAFLPGWSGSRARVAEIVIVIGGLNLVAQLVGIVGLFQRWVIVIGCAVTGVVAVVIASRRRPIDVPSGEVTQVPRAPALAVGASLVAALILVGQWAARSVEVLRHGMYQSVDTLWYHGPMAARWVQEGSITGVHYFDSEPLTAFYPGGGDLFHAVGIAVMGDDVLSPLINIGWLIIACLGAWCIGRSFGAGPSCVLAVVVALSTPLMLETQPGAMYTDIVGYAMLLCALALLVNRDGMQAAFWLAGLAAGIALGVKYTMIVPVGVLTLGVVIVTREAWWRTTALWAALLTLGGGLWYVRNLVVVLNPVPPLDLPLGPLSPPSPPLLTPSLRVIDFLGDGDIVRNVFLPGLGESFGRVWWMIVILALAGGAVALVKGATATVKVLGAMGLVSILAFLVTPQALGTEEDPFFFAVVLRYLALPLTLGLVALAVTPVLTRASRLWWLPLALTIAFVATQVNRKAWIGNDLVLAGSMVAVAAAAATLFVLWRRSPTPRALAISLAAVGLLAVVAFGAVQRGYQENRYKGYRNLKLAQWTRNVRDARIAIIGTFLQYPLYGPDLSNHVQWVAHIGSHGHESRYPTCAAWRRALNAGDYDYVLVTSAAYPVLGPDAPPAVELEWTRTDPGVSVVFRDAELAVAFRIRQPLDPAACPARSDRA